MNFKMSLPLLFHANEVLATVEYITMPMLHDTRMLALVYHIQQLQRNHGIVVVTISLQK